MCIGGAAPGLPSWIHNCIKNTLITCPVGDCVRLFLMMCIFHHTPGFYIFSASLVVVGGDGGGFGRFGRSHYSQMGQMRLLNSETTDLAYFCSRHHQKFKFFSGLLVLGKKNSGLKGNLTPKPDFFHEIPKSVGDYF